MIFSRSIVVHLALSWNEPPHDKTNKMACAPSADSDQPGHPPSLIRVFAVRMKNAWVLSYPLTVEQRLWSDWADAQPDDDLSLRWAHMPLCWFCHEAAQISFPLQQVFKDINSGYWKALVISLITAGGVIKLEEVWQAHSSRLFQVRSLRGI